METDQQGVTRKDFHQGSLVAIFLGLLMPLACSCSQGGSDSSNRPLHAVHLEASAADSSSHSPLVSDETGTPFPLEDTSDRCSYPRVNDKASAPPQVDAAEPPLFDLKYSGSFVDRYHDGGEYVVGYMSDGLRTGRWVWRWSDKRSPRIVEHYQGGKLHGSRQMFGRHGELLEQGEFREGKKEGIWRTWHPNGELASEEFYKRGKQDGCLVWWYDDGTRMSSASFVKGLKCGCERHWYQNGCLKGECYYRSGKLHGALSAWSEEGVQLVKGWYREGVKEGEWMYRNEEGAVTRTEVYEDGDLVK